jgi:hypothetical protein
VKGRVVKILVEDSSPVEYDQPLFLVEPAWFWRWADWKIWEWRHFQIFFCFVGMVIIFQYLNFQIFKFPNRV